MRSGPSAPEQPRKTHPMAAHSQQEGSIGTLLNLHELYPQRIHHSEYDRRYRTLLRSRYSPEHAKAAS